MYVDTKYDFSFKHMTQQSNDSSMVRAVRRVAPAEAKEDEVESGEPACYHIFAVHSLDVPQSLLEPAGTRCRVCVAWLQIMEWKQSCSYAKGEIDPPPPKHILLTKFPKFDESKDFHKSKSEDELKVLIKKANPDAELDALHTPSHPQHPFAADSPSSK